jgi:hypothetical protein
MEDLLAHERCGGDAALQDASTTRRAPALGRADWVRGCSQDTPPEAVGRSQHLPVASTTCGQPVLHPASGRLREVRARPRG